VHYNAKGRSRGTAIVSFHNRAHAMKAVNEYHQAEVDGRPMYVKAVATVSGTSQKSRKKSTVKRGGRGRGRRGRGRGRRGRGRGRGKGKRSKSQPSKTAEQLDKEMEDYHNMGSGSGSTVDQISAGQPDTAKLFSVDGAEE